MSAMRIIYTDRRPDHIIVGSTIAQGTDRHIVRDIMHSVWEPRPIVTFLFEDGHTLSMYADITMHACQAHHHYYVEGK